MTKRLSKKEQAAGFSLIELLIVITIIGILAAISIQYLISSRRAANGASAVATVRNISTAQTSFSAGNGNDNYGTTTDLFREEYIDTSVAAACIPLPTGNSINGTPAPTSLSPKSGFTFTVSSTPKTMTMNSTFTVLAMPVQTMGVNRSGDRQFFVDGTQVIRASNSPTMPATATSTPIN